MRRTVTLALTLATLGFGANAAHGQDPVPLYPNNYKVLYENDKVRVIDFVLRKGDTEQFHSHRPHVAYILTGFKIKFSFPDGTSKIRETRAGDVLWSDAVTHSPVNIGETDAHGIMVELKDQPAGATEAASKVDMREALLTAVTFITGKEGHEDELKGELLKTTEPTRAEPGNYRYDLFQNPAHPNQFMRIEVWQDSLALEAHKQTPPLRASFEARQRQGWMTNITTWRRVRDW
jgi:quinol monooxygenase YgiN/quercetin dioxygenase-like cupin family protein